MINKYYIYVYLNPLKEGIFKYKKYIFNFEPFYVGKGTGRRIYDHLNIKNEAKNKHNPIKYYIIKHIYENNKVPITFKIKENTTEQKAHYLERKMIKIIGRKDKSKGPLSNLTDGGEGHSGYLFTEKQREKMGKTKKILYKGKGNPFFGKHHTLKTKQIISKTHEGISLSPEHRNKVIKTLNCYNQTGKNNCMHDKHGEKHFAHKKYKITSPLNEIYNINGTIGYTIKNICKKLNISYNLLYKTLLYDKVITKGPTKGWKLEYNED